MPRDKFDSWRSYSYNVCAGRLRYLDFEVENNEESLDKLSKIKGFGSKVIKQVRRKGSLFVTSCARTNS
jgi:hypothetical protein